MSLTDRWLELRSHHNFKNPLQISSLGLSGMIILHHLPSDVPVLFIDTLDHFPETYDHYHQVVSSYPQKIFHRCAPTKTKEDLDLYFKEDPDAYTWFSKVEPLERSLQNLQVDAILTGRRRDQKYAREDLNLVEKDANGRLIINLLYDWTFRDIQNYLKEHPEILKNKLYDQGYTSIGDIRTTQKPVDENERSGRWLGSDQKECGIHTRREQLRKIFGRDS